MGQAHGLVLLGWCAGGGVVGVSDAARLVQSKTLTATHATWPLRLPPNASVANPHPPLLHHTPVLSVMEPAKLFGRSGSALRQTPLPAQRVLLKPSLLPDRTIPKVSPFMWFSGFPPEEILLSLLISLIIPSALP